MLHTFCPPGRPDHSDINSASPGSILTMQQLRSTTKSLTFPPLSIARFSFKQLSQLGRQWRERKYPIFETVAKGDSNPGSLDCESGILPLSYRTPYLATLLYTDILSIFFYAGPLLNQFLSQRLQNATHDRANKTI